LRPCWLQDYIPSTNRAPTLSNHLQQAVPAPQSNEFAAHSPENSTGTGSFTTSHKIVGAYVLSGVLAIVSYFLLSPANQLVFYDFFGIYAVAGILTGVRRNKPDFRLPWYLIACALSLLVMGDVLLNRHVQIFGTEPGLPTFEDMLFVGGNILVVISLALVLRRRLAGQDSGSLIDAMIIATAAGVLSWIFLMVPYAQDGTLTVFQRLVLVTYPCIDVLMLAVLARLVLGGGSRETAFWLIAGALTAGMAADTLWAELAIRNQFSPERGHWVDAGWLIWYVLWGAAALHPSMRTLTEPNPTSAPALTGKRLAVLTVFALIVPAAGLVEAGKNSSPTQAIVSVASCVLFFLVLWRIRGLIRIVEFARDRFEAAVERERILRQAAAALVAATDRDEIYEAVTYAAHSLGGLGALIRIAMVDRDRLAIVSASGIPVDVTFDSMSFPPEAVGSMIPNKVTIAAPDIATLMRTSLRLDADGDIRLTPLIIQGQTRGVMVVAGGRQESAEYGWLEALTSQLALALERTALAEDLHHRKSEERFRSLVRNASDIILITEADGRIRYVSPSIERILGFTPEEVIGQQCTDFIHSDDREGVRKAQEEITAVPGLTRSVEYRVLHRDRIWHHVEAIKTNLLHDESVRGIVVNMRDITERKDAEDRLTYQAFHDTLTDLPNRALFMDRLQHSLAVGTRREEGSGLIFLDLDRFKIINDSLGHEAGDRLLQMVARRLDSCIRPGDTAARLGGDEFTILLDAVVDVTDVIAIAERLTTEIRKPFTIDGREVFVTASIGITCSRPGHVDAIDLLREADIAMYQAKATGKGDYAIFDAGMGTAALKRLELETDLRHAIERFEFELYYQPAIHLNTGRVSTMEALVRWRQSDRGIVSPIEFIPLAEETGLIVPIGHWVLHEACRQAALWQEQFGIEAPTISVNLSARQLLHETIVADVAEALKAHDIPPHMITLEITETFAVEDAEANRSTLENLKSLGVRLAIDDFGSGYSSLGYLRQLPVDVLKIDRGFVKALGGARGDTLIVSAITDLAHKLGMLVVAEGIEDLELLNRVRDLGCDVGQGYYFAKPLPAGLATTFIDLDLHKATLMPASIEVQEAVPQLTSV